jgi:hypothetical protein
LSRSIDPSEHQIQAAYFEWWDLFAKQCRIPVQLCFAVPNGGLRKKGVAGKLKAEGVRAGTSDVFLLVPKGPFHGLVMEFKSRKGRPTTEQLAFLTEVRRLDYNGVFVYSIDEAIRVTTVYLAQKLTTAVR